MYYVGRVETQDLPLRQIWLSIIIDPNPAAIIHMYLNEAGGAN